MSDIHRLPDLARMRALQARVRASSDEEVADLLCTEDGQWLFVECPRYLDEDVSRRLVNVISAGLPDGTIFNLLGVTPEKGAE